uniref:Uncharacterized protein n=1 Tax=Glossina palpalis gambiensis TaxID=67801 RepID=A0A1B0AXL2_9MUSC
MKKRHLVGLVRVSEHHYGSGRQRTGQLYLELGHNFTAHYLCDHIVLYFLLLLMPCVWLICAGIENERSSTIGYLYTVAIIVVMELMMYSSFKLLKTISVALGIFQYDDSNTWWRQFLFPLQDNVYSQHTLQDDDRRYEIISIRKSIIIAGFCKRE